MQAPPSTHHTCSLDVDVVAALGGNSIRMLMHSIVVPAIRYAHVHVQYVGHGRCLYSGAP
jgi:hypothetical protein